MSTKSPSAPAKVRDIDFSDPEFLRAPWYELARLQNEAPVFWSEMQGGWIITRHADVHAALMDRRMSAGRARMIFRGLPESLKGIAPNLAKYWALNVNFLDGRDHVRIRTLMMKAFGAGSTKTLAGHIESVVSQMLDLAEDQREFDFIPTIAHVLPTLIMQKILDLPSASLDTLFRLTVDLVAVVSSLQPNPTALATAEKSIVDLNKILNDLIAMRETSPGSDLISSLVHARDGLSRLTNDELLGCLQAVIVAGAETTTHSLGVGLKTIAEEPRLQARLREDPMSAYATATELLRYPGTIKSRSRIALEDFELHGKQIRIGDLIWIMVAGANTDTRAFQQPFVVDVDRDNRGSMAFGPGMHFCLGHLLAKAELAEFFKQAFTRFDVEILGKEQPMVRNATFYGFREIQARFTPRA